MSEKKEKPWYAKAEYLAVFVSLVALSISAFEPVSRFFASPKLVVDLPRYITLSTNIGILQISPNVSVSNEGNSAGSFSRMTCRLSKDGRVWELPATTINVGVGGGPGGTGTIDLSGYQLEAGGAFLNSVNCIDVTALNNVQDEHARLYQRAVFESSQAVGLTCEEQYQTKEFQHSRELTNDLMESFRKAFFLSPGRYSFEIEVSDREGTSLANAKAEFDLSKALVQQLAALKDELPYGIGVVCPPPPLFYAQVVLDISP